eukprot:53686-Eustigmatos_ZCMA.PRE.1
MAADEDGFFLAPVDPVELDIPDYFEVVTKPMDLGTVQVRQGWPQYVQQDVGERLCCCRPLVLHVCCNETGASARWRVCLSPSICRRSAACVQQCHE